MSKRRPGHESRWSLGRAIAARRAELGRKRADVAEAAEISYSHLTEIENGNKSPSRETLERLAVALRMRPHDLLRRSDMLETTDPEAPAERPWMHFAAASGPAPPAQTRDASPDPIAELLAVVSRMSEEDVQTLVALARRLSDGR